MRRIALAPLLAVSGCNWVFGLEPTVAVDAAPVSELPPGPRTRLLWGIATTDGQPAPGIDPVLEYKPIGSEGLYPEPPRVQVGDDTGLADATYDPSDGSFEIPYPLRESPHRIVYTLPGESVPHEVQWALTGALLVVPRTTRADAPPPPANSGYKITPSGLGNGGVPSPAAFTSGVFTATDDPQAFTVTGAEITFRYAAGARPLAGPVGAPQSAKGDWVLVTNWAGSARRYVDGWALTSVDLLPNAMSVPATQPEWKTTLRTLSTANCPQNCLPTGNAGSMAQRLLEAVGGLGGPPPATYALAYGVSPSTELPGFLPGGPPSYLERPLLVPFVTSTQIDSMLTFADPAPSLGLAPVLFARVATTRNVGGLALTSAIQTVTNVFSGSIQYPAPVALNIKLGAVSLSSEQVEGVAVAASTSPVTLTFETEAGFSADDFVVTLFEVTGTTLAPVRIYHVIQPSVKIDGNLLVSGRTYAIGITARTGFGGADRGDYQTAQYPFGSTTTFPRTFVIQ